MSRPQTHQQRNEAGNTPQGTPAPHGRLSAIVTVSVFALAPLVAWWSVAERLPEVLKWILGLGALVCGLWGLVYIAALTVGRPDNSVESILDDFELLTSDNYPIGSITYLWEKDGDFAEVTPDQYYFSGPPLEVVSSIPPPHKIIPELNSEGRLVWVAVKFWAGDYPHIPVVVGVVDGHGEEILVLSNHGTESESDQVFGSAEVADLIAALSAHSGIPT